MKPPKNRKNKLIPTICRNCGTQTHGRYCHACGQDIFVGKETSTWNIVYAFLENAIAFDSKIPRTYYYLLFRPGFLSLEYTRGRIVRYIAPIKLLWFIVIIFFAITITSNSVAIAKNELKETAADTTEQATQAYENDSTASSTDSVTLDSEQFLNIFFAALPYLAFVSIPFVAFIMYLFFRNKRRFFVNSFIFSTHLYAALFLLLLIYHLVGIVLPKDFHFRELVEYILLLIPLIYYFIAIRVFYKSSYVGVIVKGVIVLLLSLFTMVSVLTGFILLFALYKGIEVV